MSNKLNINGFVYKLAVLVLTLGLSACDSSDSASKSSVTAPITLPESNVILSDLDRSLLEIASNLKLTGDPSQGRSYPPVQDSLVQLGKQLFFQPYTLQGHTFTCAQCHDPLQGGTQRQALATGIPKPQSPKAIPDYLFHRGRTLLPVRNAPSIFNLGLWDTAFFQDGRIQALKPDEGENGSKGGINTPDVLLGQADPQAGRNLVQAAAKMNLVSRSQITPNISLNESASSPYTMVLNEHLSREQQRFSPPAEQWLSRFRQGFNTPDGLALTLVTPEKTAEALAAYMRSQVFVNNPWKHYLEGDPNAISEVAKQGALLFFRNPQQGGFGCARCHSGDLFTDEKMYRTLIPSISLPSPLSDEMDYGRWFMTHEDKDKFAFRTPSLLNVTETGPWGHNGAYFTLSGMVRHMLDPVLEVSQYDTFGLTAEGLVVNHLAARMNTMLSQGIDLTSQKYSQKEFQALLAFLYTLTDPCVKDAACLKPWLAD
ncbi:cytochrome-c peroxidase [Thiofilum flexile]|uniref:cytochrome-c peroxidase n=1 Tax=Thiofilum flexile TaxID=125627 RepID=UPI00035C812F|nr:cytochrome c peroxidase [Thiofilum flexile]